MNGETASASPPEETTLEAGKIGRVRQPIQFSGLGLQLIDLRFTTG